MSYPTRMTSHAVAGPRTRGVTLGQAPTELALAPAAPSLVQKLLSNPLYLAGYAVAAFFLYRHFAKSHGYASNPRRRRKKTKSTRARAHREKSVRHYLMKKQGWRIQSILYPKKKFSRAEAAKLARNHMGRKPIAVEDMKNFWRARMESATHFKKFRAVPKGRGTRVVFALPKQGHGKRKNAEIQTLDGGVIYV